MMLLVSLETNDILPAVTKGEKNIADQKKRIKCKDPEANMPDLF